MMNDDDFRLLLLWYVDLRTRREFIGRGAVSIYRRRIGEKIEPPTGRYVVRHRLFVSFVVIR